jgi:RNA polymerase sigma-70 factor (ECF subfamily)
VFFKAVGKRAAILKLDQIISECIKGDRKSKEWLYKFFYGYLMAVMIRYITKTHEAEELVNDSFIKIFNHLHHFKLPQDPVEHLKGFKGWMARIASRTAIDFLRIDKNHRYAEELSENILPADPVNIIVIVKWITRGTKGHF